MSQERVFGITILSYTLYLYSSKNLSEVRQLVRYLFGWLPFNWSFELSYFLAGQIVLPIICFVVPFILFSGFFRIRL
jgi:hypothetical protein